MPIEGGKRHQPALDLKDPLLTPTNNKATTPKPPIITRYDPKSVSCRLFDWCAVRDDYDGAPDSHCPRFGQANHSGIVEEIKQKRLDRLAPVRSAEIKQHYCAAGHRGAAEWPYFLPSTVGWGPTKEAAIADLLEIEAVA
jgi:hypothetical protein